MLSVHQIAHQAARDIKRIRQRKLHNTLVPNLEEPISSSRDEGEFFFGIYMEAGELEILRCYSEELCKIGVDVFSEEILVEICSNPTNIESACLVTLQYAEREHFQENDESHPINFFVRAIKEGWKPRF